MQNSTPWLQHVSEKLAANDFRPMTPEKYQPLGFKYVVHRSRFEPSKFGMAERFLHLPRSRISTQPFCANFQAPRFNSQTKTSPRRSRTAFSWLFFALPL